MKNLFGYYFDKRVRHHIITLFGIKIKIKKRVISKSERLDYLYTLINHCIDITKIPPACGEIRNIQLELADLMTKVDILCRENNLKYWLDSGTLIGAYRHKGFIPWDADIDLCMMREDYDKLYPLIKDMLKSTNYYLRERADKCNNFQLRIVSKSDSSYGIDIFPVDEYPETVLTPQLKEDIKNNMIKAQNLFNKKYKKRANLTQEEFEQAKKDLIVYRDKYILEGNKTKVEKPIIFFGIDFTLKGKYSFAMPYDYIFPLCELDFEGKKFYCPNNVEAYLDDKYNGHYMNFPKFVNNVCDGEIKYLR